MDTPDALSGSTQVPTPTVPSQPASSPIESAQSPAPLVPNSPEQREGLRELADLLQTVAEYFQQKDARELADRLELWNGRVRRLLERARSEAGEGGGERARSQRLTNS